ncbi:hypothetical protein LL254_06045 [Marinobacter nauticus]|uniref:DUF4870 family protein n=1 Tax=Marinobacter nauticus TaxID=2743 RepID=UPI001C96E4C3|nr:hypothetical protein [Marinobacter nauticus]MBY5961116.1 hypothetical protein [Marinobacter nauticus]MBY6104507.1 hypothetical protein [Marinobacter nauticus]MCC4270265.1 hypothetical protein [Marinobacter nauticus]
MSETEYIPAKPDDQQSQEPSSARNLAVVVYILQALSFFLGGLTALVGVIINYVKLDDVRGTWIEPHFRWQIRTFWIGLLWTVIGVITTMLIVGWFILLGIAIWVIYRIVKGALALNDGKTPM